MANAEVGARGQKAGEEAPPFTEASCGYLPYLI
ncbi:hypothetical protein J2S34_000293 [Nitrobacter winogradskyi]|uniref:Uncharacterized protein n=1 Tax=Nitrobacter winogradskyi TaxID=913 RepID=A0ACC6AE34_NITWI|nr:hypothetical protein [Nitrobacter winogradskyi]